MIETHDLGFHHPGSPWLFQGVDVTFGDGTVSCVLGPNGRGKTTLLRCLLGLAKPVEGTVVCDGAAAYVPQAAPLGFAFSVLDVVLMGRARSIKVFAQPTSADRSAASAALERVGALGVADQHYPTLSGGERQLVLLARALCSGHRTLVLDEPDAALDVRNQGQLLGLCRALADEGYAVVMSTHHPDHAAAVADQIVLMRSEEVVAGATSELLTGPRLSELYDARITTVDVEGGGRTRTVVVPHYDL